MPSPGDVTCRRPSGETDRCADDERYGEIDVVLVVGDLSGGPIADGQTAPQIHGIAVTLMSISGEARRRVERLAPDGRHSVADAGQSNAR